MRFNELVHVLQHGVIFYAGGPRVENGTIA